jgi:hypothetical protein
MGAKNRAVESIVALLVEELRGGGVRTAEVRACVAEEVAARPGADEDALARLRILAIARSRLGRPTATGRR